MYLYSVIFYFRTLNPELLKRERISGNGSFLHIQPSLYAATIEPNGLCNNETFLLVGIISKPSNQMHRMVYRDTVLSSTVNNCNSDTKYLFLVGQPNNQELQYRLSKESGLYGDILQGNFSDTYENLTIKSLFLIRWVQLHCPMARYLFKLDDDVFAVISDIRHYLKHIPSRNHYTIFGSVFKNSKPDRNPSHKWYAGNYPNKVYPVYVSGTAYVLPCQILEQLFTAALTIPFVRLEDIFITGLSVAATNLTINHRQFPGFTYEKRNFFTVNFNTVKTCHSVSTEQLPFLYKRLKAQRQTDCI